MSQCFDHNFLLKISDCNEIGGIRKLTNDATNISETAFVFFSNSDVYYVKIVQQ
jgi:hypothetical protein